MKSRGDYSGQPLRFGTGRASVLLPFTLSVPVPAAHALFWLKWRCHDGHALFFAPVRSGRP